MKSYGGSFNNTMPKKEEIRRSREASSKSGSDDWVGNEDQNYDFEQIFDDQALSKEEEELFNQLKANEQHDGGQTFDLTKERSDREEEKREIEDDGDMDETMKYNHHLVQDQNLGEGAFRLRGSETNHLNLIPSNKNERYYNDCDEYEENKADSPNNQDEDFKRDPNDDQDEIQQPHGYSSAERIVESDTQDEEIQPRPSRNQF